MNDLKRRLVPHYRRAFITTETVNNDIKLIKKLNMLFGKLEKTQRDVYVLEIINTIKILNNVLRVEMILLVIYECVEAKYHDTLDLVLQKVIST